MRAEAAARVAELRGEFDHGFAVAHPLPAPAARDFVTMHLGRESYAVALEELAGIVPAGRIMPLPGSPSFLLGAMGLKGDIVFVQDTALLLGQPAAAPRWLLLAAGGWAFAFERLGVWLRLAEADIAWAGDTGPLRRAVRRDGRPILSLGALLERIRPEERAP